MTEAMEPARQVFQSLTPALIAVFYLIVLAALAVFVFGLWRRIAKYRSARPAGRFNRPWARTLDLVPAVAAHRTLSKRDLYAGLAHGMMFWGFAALFTGSLLIALDQDVLRPWWPDLRFWHGDFYKWFSLLLDLLGLGLLAGLIMMAARRWITRPERLDYARPDRGGDEYDRRGYRRDDQILLWGLILIVATGFALEALRIAIAPPPFEIWSVVGWQLAALLGGLGLSGELAREWHALGWWFHTLLALAFIAYLPFSKAVHILAAIAGLFFRDPLAGRCLPAIADGAERMGYAGPRDFSWKELLDFDACTRCGRCHASCPAAASGWPLSPRDVILELGENTDLALGGGKLFHETKSRPGPANGMGIKSETLWSCTTCLACVETCPVGVEHVPLIVQLRRNLLEQGDLDRPLQEILEKLMRYGNSFGAPETERGNWTEDLEFAIKDVRETEVDYLWFVGDYASFDPQVRKTTQAVARVFHAAGLDFGILREGERNAGNDIRRVGEEGLFELLREHNSTMLSAAKFNRIVTTDPHSLNALNFEYPALDRPVRHYTEVIRDLIAEGRLTLKKRLDGRVTYHDPCHLSRYACVTEPPREILRALGLTLVEMGRSGTNSFCCGAGGGRIWMTDPAKMERPAERRIKEALEIEGIEHFAVACPKCFSMCREAAVATGNEAGLPVRDLIEFVEEAIA